MCIKYRLQVVVAIVSVTCVARTIYASTAANSPTIRDLVQLTVLNQRSVAIAPGGGAVAYVAVTPEIDSDSYRAELRVATIAIGNAVQIYNIATASPRAVRTPETDGDELPGSFINAAIELTWSDDGSTLFYSIAVKGKSEVHTWDRKTIVNAH